MDKVLVGVNKAMGVGWFRIAIVVIGVVGFGLVFLDFLFLQHPDIGFGVFSFLGFVAFLERVILSFVTPLGLVGLVLFVLGTVGVKRVSVYLHEAGVVLGPERNRDRKTRKLCTSGLYKYIRHPLYLFTFFWFFGVTLAFGSVVAFLFFELTLVPLTLMRIPFEEERLVKEFGDEYKEYQERTKKLVPFVY